MAFVHVLQATNVFAFIFMLLMSIIASYVHFNGETNSSISKRHPTRITPANWTFLIWIPIYLLLGLFSVYQALPRNANGIVSTISIFFVLNMLFNGVWPVPFAYEIFWLSLILILGNLATLIIIYLKLNVRPYKFYSPIPTVESIRDRDPLTSERGLEAESRFVMGENDVPLMDFWLVHAPFSLYLGWISVATIVNIAIFLSASPVNWDGSPVGAGAFSVILQVLATVLAFMMLYLRGDVLFALVISWALAGICNKQRDDKLVEVFAAILASVTALSAIMVFLCTSRWTRERMKGMWSRSY